MGLVGSKHVGQHESVIVYVFVYVCYCMLVRSQMYPMEV